jgi:hypothetical protein
MRLIFLTSRLTASVRALVNPPDASQASSSGFPAADGPCQPPVLVDAGVGRPGVELVECDTSVVRVVGAIDVPWGFLRGPCEVDLITQIGDGPRGIQPCLEGLGGAPGHDVEQPATAYVDHASDETLA